MEVLEPLVKYTRGPGKVERQMADFQDQVSKMLTFFGRTFASLNASLTAPFFF